MSLEIKQSRHFTTLESQLNELQTSKEISKAVIDQAVLDEETRIKTFAKETGLKAYTTIKELSVKIQKENKPDNTVHVKNGEGVFTTQDSFTDAKFKAVKSLIENHNKLVEAFDKAIESSKLCDFEALAKLLNTK